MIRQIIEIDEAKCTGCGICAEACHEGAIAIIDGKAKLVRDDYCDGFGDCLPTCPTGAITFVEREAAEYDETAVEENKRRAKAMQENAEQSHSQSGCPGSRARTIQRDQVANVSIAAMAQQAAGQFESPAAASFSSTTPTAQSVPSQLQNWPVQIKLAPVQAPYFEGANLLIAADCCAFSYGNFHQDFIRNRVALIGCPKLDAVDYTEKLTQIIANNDIKSVTITRMEVPCCGGLERAAIEALKASGKFLPWQVVTFSLDGRILD